MVLNLTQKFMYEISQTDIVAFQGLVAMLRVPVLKEGTDEVREFEDVFGDVMAAYDKLGRKRKKEILKVLRDNNAANRDISNIAYDMAIKEAQNNANSAENSTN